MYPVISPGIASSLAAFFTFSYVGSLYIARAGRLAFHAPPVNVPDGEERVRIENEKWRNDPDVIRARLIASALSTVSSCVVVGLTVWKWAAISESIGVISRQLMALLGVTPSLPSARSLLPHLLAPLLYIGPLYSSFLFSSLPMQSRWSFSGNLAPIFTTWVGIRNFIAAPITEEIVFRSCISSVMLLSGASAKQIIFLGPLWFGIAHAHHAWELFNIYGRTKQALIRALVTSAAQLVYTSLFGWFASFILLRTGSIYTSITSHVFCNIMGLPSPGWYADRFPTRSAAIWIAHVVGVIAFGFALGPWTAGFQDHLYAL